jgi:AMP-polyphosphate phosphotransferase
MLEKFDLSKKLEPADYKEQLEPLQNRLQALGHELYVQKRALVVGFEGWDAAGKGGAIKRLTDKLDSRGYEVFPIAAPLGEDKTHHYLWRFWRRFKPPHEKQIQIFDRSWYGRVMVERVEGYCTEAAWKRSYREINDFERQLSSGGFILGKFWLQISQEEQLRRFEARKANPAKAWKFTSEDLRNREKWPQYEKAVEEMIVKTSTLIAPWTVVEANDKYYARIKILNTLITLLCSELDYQFPDDLKKKKKHSKG